MTPLHWIGNVLREAFQAVPMGAVQVLFVLLSAALLLWVVTLPVKDDTGEDRRNAIKLKIGASIALGVQIVLYSVC